MRTKILLLFAILFASNGMAQYDSKGELTSRFRAGFMWYYTGLRPAKTEMVRKYDRLIFDITYNDWNGDYKPFQNHWASIGFNTNFMFDIPLTKGNTVSIGVGISHQLTRVRHDGMFFKDENLGQTTFSGAGTSNFDKNVLVGNAFSVPLELRFRKESWKHFKFHIGGKIGYQGNMFSKTTFNQGPDRIVSRNYGFPDLNRIVFGAHLRLGLRNWALYASYNFNPLFTNAKSTKINQLQFGLSVSLF